MKIIIDKDLCIGCGTCAAIASKSFKMGEDGKAELIDLPVGKTGTITRLTVYDITGRLVKTLVDKQQPAGTYKVEWNASREKIASGIYFYKLKIGNYETAKKLVLL